MASRADRRMYRRIRNRIDELCGAAAKMMRGHDSIYLPITRGYGMNITHQGHLPRYEYSIHETSTGERYLEGCWASTLHNAVALGTVYAYALRYRPRTMSILYFGLITHRIGKECEGLYGKASG
jgi:hypothetical protein